MGLPLLMLSHHQGSWISDERQTAEAWRKHEHRKARAASITTFQGPSMPGLTSGHTKPSYQANTDVHGPHRMR